jgi:parvulin-like peptidyl-prolyl isomerase
MTGQSEDGITLTSARTIARLAGVAAALGAALLPCAGAGDGGRRTVDRIAAVVGTEIVLLSEVALRAKPQLAELEQAKAKGENAPAMMIERRRGQIFEEALGEIIDDYLVRQQADQMKVKVSTEEVEAAIANMARENGIDLETFEQVLMSRGTDMISYRSEMRRNLLRYKVLNLRVRGRVSITDDEARQYYNDQVRNVRATGTFEGAHILIRVSPDAKAIDVAKLKKRAEEVRGRVAAGEDFADVARELSQDEKTAAKGGSLGTLRTGKLAPAVDRAFLDLEPGEIAGPVRTAAGFHVVRLVDREALGVQPFSEVKNRILNQLMQEEMERQQKIWLKELRRQTFIEERL